MDKNKEDNLELKLFEIKCNLKNGSYYILGEDIMKNKHVYIIDILFDLYKSNLIDLYKLIELLETIKVYYKEKDLDIMKELNKDFGKMTILDYMWNKKFYEKKIDE